MAAANILRTNVRQTDIVARYGGDVGSVAVTISMGMVTRNDGRRFEDWVDLVNAADKALYTAKLQGRNRSVRFEGIADSQAAAIRPPRRAVAPLSRSAATARRPPAPRVA